MVNINEIKEGTLGNDPMYGGTGDDTLYGYSGIDTYVYNFGDGNDLIEDSDKSIFQFGEGIDLDDLEFETFDFQSGLIVTVKGSGTITIPDYFYIAGSKFVFADGTSFTTDNFPKFLTGSDGADKNTSMLAPNTFKNNDMIYGKGGNDSINGWAGDDLINGGAGNDNLIGSDGNDTLIGAEGSDTLLGGKGNDVYYVDSQAGDTLVEVLNEGIDTVISSASYSLGTNFDNLTLTDLATDGTGNALANVIKGNTEDNLLDGDAGNDALIGGDGNDTLIGGTGTDSMVGGEGNDVYSIDTTTDVISENSNSGIDTVISTISYNLGNNLENLNLIGSSNINAKGNASANIIEGNDGNNNIDGGIGADTLTGGAGNDTLTGGTGADSMMGGLGDDTYYIDNAEDKTVENTDEGTDTVISSNNSYVLSDNIENLVLSNLTAIGTGNDLANSITGNALSNVLDGGTGADTLTGGAGNDLYYVDDTADVIDVIVEKLNEGLDEVISTAESFSLDSNVENLYLDGSAITAIGNSLANKITGNDEDNIFDAGIGNDTLTGGIGNDSMAGGVGNDLYIYNAGDGNDTISDLSGTDTIQFGEDIIFDKLSISGVEGGLLVEFLDEDDEVIDGDSITIVGSAVEKLKFSNGSVRDISTLKFGTDDGETLEGSTGNDTIVGAGGDDELIGYAGNDTYYYNLGDGNDNISDTGANTYRFGEGITLADLDFANSDSTNLIINFEDGGSITINEFFGKNTGSKFIFADGTTLDAGKFANLLSGDDDTDDVTGPNYQSALSGNNIIYSRGSNDNINGWAGDDLINGGADDDYLSGGAGNDIIFGGIGDDIIDGGAGSDTMAGGTGNDAYTVNVATDIIQENSDEGIDTVSTGINYSLGANIENLTLSAPATNGTGNDLNNVITGNLLSNLISGREGDDTLDGGAGNDTLIGGTGADSMAGGLGNDVYFVDDAGDIVSENANAGTDTVISSIDYIMEDTIEKLNLTGSAIEGTGNDLANVITGNSLDNIIDGGIGNDTLDGGAGNDTLIGGEGSDILSGGTGDDVYYVADTTDKVTENLNAGTDTIITSQNYTLSANVENLTILDEAEIGTGNNLANIITGNLFNNLLSGGLGNDTLIADEGDDTLVGGTGSDVMIGGIGNDTYYVDNSADKISENPDEGTDTVISSASYTLSENIENLNLTGTAISGEGNDLDNVITGNASNNLLDGAAGNDTLDGLGGADSMIGGLGNDTYYVDNAGDKISENLDEGTDTVISSINYTLASDTDNLTITGSALIAAGNTLANLITANALNNTIDGKGGADTLIGDAGNDTYTFNKGYGQNLIIDTAGTDTISFVADIALGDLNVTQDVDDLVISLGGSDSITIKDWYAGNKIETFVMSNGTTYAGDYIAALSTASGGTSGNDVLEGTADDDILFGYEGDDLLTGGAANDYLYGGDGDDELNGEEGNDYLYGGAGNDNLEGEAGSDYLSGGTGNDNYYFAPDSNSGNDTISEEGGDRDSLEFSSGDESYVKGINVNLASGTISGLAAGHTITGDIKKIEDIIGTNYNDSLIGNSLGNYLDGSKGDDTIYGGAGNDLYSFSAEDGYDTITDVSGNDTIILDDSVVDWNPLRVGNDLVIDYSADYLGNDNGISKITVKNQFGTPSTPVETLIVDNEILSFSDSSIGTNSADTLNGTASDNLFVGNDGNDLLGDTLGGNDYYYAGRGNDVITDTVGDDTYFFASGDGNDTITDSAGTDIIKLCWDIHQNEVTYEKNPDNLDLIINISDTDKITVKNWFADDKYKVEAIYSENNPDPIATKESIDALLGISSGEGTSENDVILTGTSDDTITPGLGNDYIVDKGGNDLYNFVPVAFDGDGNFIDKDGSDTITDFGGNDTIVLENTSLADVKFEMSGNDLIIKPVSTSLTAKITVKDWAVSTDNRIETLAFNNIIHDPNLLASFEELQSNFALIDAFFENTTVLNNLQNLKLGTAATTETITCLANNDVIISGTGTDTIIGGAGDDTYIFSLGDGIKTIIDASGSDRIILKNFSDYGLDFVRNGDDLSATFDTANKFTVKSWFLNNANKIETLELADIGIKVDLTNYIVGTDLADTLTGSADGSIIYDNKGNDKIFGLSSNDTYISGAGNDTINDAGGDDYYTFKTGNGQDVINDAAGDDTILINTANSFNVNDKSNFTRSGNDLTVKYKSDGTDQVTIKGWFDNSANKIENFDISASNGHFELTSSDIDALYEGDSIQNNETNDDIILTSNDDGVVYDINGGFDTITDLGGNDTLTVNGYDVYNDVDFFKEGNNLKIEFQPNDTITGSVTIKDWKANKIENLVFNYNNVSTAITSDMLVVGAATGNTTVSSASTDTFLKSSTANNLIIMHSGNDNISDPGGNDIIFAGAGNDIITDTAGNDTISGDEGNDTITDNAGNDLYVYYKGDGKDVITDLAGTDTISFRDDITSDDISFMAGGNGIPNTTTSDLIIGIGEMQDTINGGSIVVKDFFNAAKPNNKIEEIDFSDGKKILIKGGVTSGADAISDTTGENYVYISGAGNDTITDTIGGNDIYIVNQGDGKDVIADKFGDDTLYLTGAISDSVHFEKAGTGSKDLLIKFKVINPQTQVVSYSTTDTVTVKNWFSGEGEAYNRIETISLSDGTELTVEDVDYYISNGHISTGSTLPGATEQDDTLQGTSGRDFIMGLAGNDLIYGEGMADTIIGGLGNDTLVGGAGFDIYVFNPGDGQDVIIENELLPNVIAFGGGITAEDIIFTKDGTSLIISGNESEDSMTLTGWFNDQGGFANTSVTLFQFNGEPLPRDVQYVFDKLGGNNGGDGGTPNNGTNGNDTLTDPLDVDVIFTGGLGDDLLIGGAGCDTYVFNRGDGNDTIIETAPGDEFGNNIDTIRFGTGIAQNDLTFANSNNDLLVTVNNSGGTITIKNWFDGSQHGGADMNVEIFAFVDDPNNSLNPQQILTIINGGGDQGGTPTAGDDLLMGSPDDELISGLAGNDTINGLAGNDTIVGGLGNDRLLDNVGGNTLYKFDQGDGHDFIFDQGGSDTIHFGSGISETSLTYSREFNDLVIKLVDYDNNLTGDQIFIDGYYFDPANAKIEYLTFDAQPGVVDLNTYVSNLQDTTQGGQGGDDTISYNLVVDDGTHNLNGTEGADSIVGCVSNDTMTGGAGSDIYVFNRGDGNDTIIETAPGDEFGNNIDTIQFGTGIAKNDLTFANNNNDLLVTVNNSGGTITVKNWFDGSQHNGADMNVEIFAFVDDPNNSLNPQQIQALINDGGQQQNNAPINGTEQDDNPLLGIAGNDSISGLGGNDYIMDNLGGNDTVNSGTGNDMILTHQGNNLYEFNIGDGNDTIADYQGLDTIKFGTGITENNLTYKHKYTNIDDLIIELVDGNWEPTGQSVTIEDYYGNSDNKIENIIFTDSEWQINLQGVADALSISGDEFDNYITGTPDDELIYGEGGNDTVNGNGGIDEIECQDGNDTYIFNRGNGVYLVWDNGGTDTIQFGTGIAATDLVFGRMADDMVISIYSGGQNTDEKVIIENYFAVGFEQNKLEAITFTDEGNSPIAISDIAATADANILGLAFTGTASNDTIIGTTDLDGDTINGGLGNDYLYGRGGPDVYQFASGDGNDTIVSSFGIQKISFDPSSNVTMENINFVQSNFDLIINYGANDSITVPNWFNPQGMCMYQVENIILSDGVTTITPNALTYYFSHANSFEGYDWNQGGGDSGDTITGTDGNDFLSGDGGENNTGNNTIVFGKGIDVVSDVFGDDNYLFNIGDGQKIIGDTNGNDTISFGEGIGIDDLSFKSYQQNDHDDLRIFVNGTQDQIAIDYYYEEVGEPPFSEQLYAIETLKFADGSSVALSDYAYSINNPSLEPLSLPDLSTAGNDTIMGSEVGDSMMDNLGGDDTYFGYTGIDMISDNAGNDTAYLTKLPTGGGLTRNDLDFSQVGNHLLIQYKTENGYWGHNTTILDWFLGDTFKIENFVIGDDTISSNAVDWYLTYGNLDNFDESYTYDIFGTVNDDLIVDPDMPGSQDNDIFGLTGNDTIIGGKDDDCIEDVSGNELYVFNRGDGQDEILDMQGSDTISFGADIAPSEINFTRYNDYLIINDIVTGDMISVAQYYGNDTINEHGSGAIEYITFADYPDVIDVASVADNLTGIDAIIGTEDDDVINDTLQTPFIIGLAGNDVITTDKADGVYINGGSGNDTLSGGIGNDTIYGGIGDDELYGGAGDDTLHAGTGDNWIYGGAGNDTYIFDNGNVQTYDEEGDNTFIFMPGTSATAVTVTHSSAVSNDQIILESIDHTALVFDFNRSVADSSVDGHTMLVSTFDETTQIWVDRQADGNTAELGFRGVEQLVCQESDGDTYYLTRTDIEQIYTDMAAYVGGEANFNEYDLSEIKADANLMTIISTANWHQVT